MVGLNFKGTVTDFRRAAATLTGQMNPDLAEKMALFLGHSRRVHDRHYRIQLGDFGLAEVFKQLEVMQTNPYPCNSLSNSSLSSQQLFMEKHQSIESNVFSHSSLTDMSIHCEGYMHDDAINLDFDSNISIVTPPVEAEISVELVENTIDDLDETPDDIFELSWVEIDDDIPINGVDKNTNDPSTIADENSTCHLNVNTNTSFHVPSIGFSDIRPPSSVDKGFIDKQSTTNLISTGKVCRLLISPLKIDSPLQSSPHNRSLFSKLYGRSHHRSIFTLREDEHLFISVFSDLINRVAQGIIVTRKMILEKAYSNSDMVSLIKKLQTYSSDGDVEKKIVNKVRTLGYKTRNNLQMAS